MDWANGYLALLWKKWWVLVTLKDLKWERICSSYFVDPICFVGILKFSRYEVHRQLEDVNAVFRSWKRLGFYFPQLRLHKLPWLFFCLWKIRIGHWNRQQKKHVFSKRSLIFSLFAHCFCCWKKTNLSWQLRPRIRSTITTNIFYFSFIPEKAAVEEIWEKVVDFLDFGRNFHDF